MSSYNYAYTSPPTSPTYGFFPSGPASPHAFSSFHQDPRQTHNMYASLGSAMGYQSSGHSSQSSHSHSHHHSHQRSSSSSSSNPLKKLYRR
ncbi:hypothetical protein SERLADRAFT_376867 [Serpula lacrymans var. lacrymans S7.9]|uniref:Uncharacterized protein n=1 Tax=Serpula lacrymans var. lacrymans (strain S7.9) TaxID=578457 RepID=F8NF32_SERL9|nr:uncharacterized protein SERLADRAFT_376867 [Serpula lacrymans var. lacrymans S7.9]EGO31152.1 hypothetical protein SERLADRAFT_376867 [Serpula lacrymans var. lacrymans S7.9]